MKKILIIEDDKSILELQKDYLEANDFEVECACDGISGLEMIKRGGFDLVILDIMLPGIGGFDILKEIAEKKQIPVLVVSAKSDEVYKIKGLNLGADDYITKPFGMGELVARVKSHLKRYEKFNSKGPENKTICVRGLVIHEDDRRAFINDVEIMLPQKEFELLLFLAKNPNHVFSKEELFEKIWGMDAISDVSTVTVHVARIREKIEAYAPKGQYIETVWGTGYRMKI